MGGDHKCPVCQATFTRPQHVARHMRSHTGDRPYKCQYCGDQFARSDLLSRHVNKCHANEKPLPNAGARRKGSASASRATTSKQACDQCVQSSLPCDGCNPCSKCIQRKCRCTYVKFHRQTAPAGPGHNTRPVAPPGTASLSSSLPNQSLLSSSRISLYQQPEDDFILGPAPSNVSTMAESLYNSNSFAFPPLYPSNGDGSDGDFASKYRANADLFGPGRSGLGTGLTPLYDPRPGSSTSSSSWLSGWESQGSSADPHDAYAQQQHSRQGDLLPPTHNSSSAAPMHDKHLQAELNASNHYMNGTSSSSGTSSSTSGGAPVSYQAAPTGNYTLPPMHLPSHGQHIRGSSAGSGSINSRRGSVDYSGSERGGSGGTGTGSSVPSSAASSNAHLPIGAGGQYANTGYNLVGGNLSDRTSNTSLSSTGSHRGYDRYAPNDDRHEFSSAFGLMSLDDPAVLAGIAVDGQPFFSDQNEEDQHEGLLTTDVGPDIDTPMPLKRGTGQLHMPVMEQQRPATSSGIPGSSGTSFGVGGLPTPSKDADSRELKDFWKQYMRTPLSGPGPVGLDAGWNNTKSTPTPYRRQRVASLPSQKTPGVERGEWDSLMPGGGYGYHPGQQQQQSTRQHQQEGGAGAKQGPMSSMRTTLHGNAEDLRSYEAAVLARKAPTMLNLQVRRPTKTKGGPPGHSQRADSRSESESANSSPQMSFHGGSRPGSALDSGKGSSTSSTLAGAFGGPRASSNQPPMSTASTRVSFAAKQEDSDSPPSHSISSRDSSLDPDGNSGMSSSDGAGDSLRPSFKRLPSQTLGPANSKRAFLGFGDDVEERERAAGWGPGAAHGHPSDVKAMNSGVSGGLNGMSHPDRVIASIAERRRRRMSAPSASLGPVDVRSSNTAGGGGHSGGGAVGGDNVPGLGYAPAAQGGMAG